MIFSLFQRLTWSNALQGEVRVGRSTLYRSAAQLISDSCFEISSTSKCHSCDAGRKENIRYLFPVYREETVRSEEKQIDSDLGLICLEVTHGILKFNLTR